MNSQYMVLDSKGALRLILFEPSQYGFSLLIGDTISFLHNVKKPKLLPSTPPCTLLPDLGRTRIFATEMYRNLLEISRTHARSRLKMS